MKKRIRILGLLVMLVTTISISATPVLGYIEQYGWESTNSGGKVSKVKIQAHAVYADNDQGGVTSFGVWVNGYTSTDDRITVKIYVSAKYHYQEINWRTMEFYETYYWDPIPSSCISWGGEYDYCASVPVTWRWSVGVSAYGMSTSATFQENPTASYGAGSGTSGDFRFLGWFRSSYSNGHEFSSLLKLHLINDEMKDWAQGTSDLNWPIESMTTIEQIRVKLVFEYSYAFLWWYQTSTTRTYIMGDGSPSTDLNYIPIEVGTIN